MTPGSALAYEFSSRMMEFFAGQWPTALAVACSGGGDSMALLGLASRWGEETGTSVHAVVIDHGLRDGSAEVAATATEAAASLGTIPVVLEWRGWQGQGNLQEVARTARRELLSNYAREHGIPAVLLGHTLDDQAETFLMRLARGSGVEGLSGMAREIDVDRTRFLRPLLSVRRETLRDFLRERGIAWAEDPSNDDPRFDRVRMRGLLPLLDDNGLSADRLVATADALRGVAEVVSARAREAAETCISLEFGDVLIDRTGLASFEEDTQNRIFAHGLCWVSGNRLRPRLSALKFVLSDVLAGGRATLHGCLIYQQGASFRLTREFSAVSDLVVPASERWDGRWGAQLADSRWTLQALGKQGIEFIEKTERVVPKETLLAMPSVWKNKELIAVPMIGWGTAVTLTRNPDNSAFFSTLFSR